MHEPTAYAAPQALRHALRALVLLGGAVLGWLVLSGGPAHADDVRHPSDAPMSAAHGQGEPPAHLVTDTLRRAPAATKRAVAPAAKAAPRPLRTAVDHVTTPIEPTLTRATTMAADRVDQTVRTVAAAVGPIARIASHEPGQAAQPSPATAVEPAKAHPHAGNHQLLQASATPESSAQLDALSTTQHAQGAATQQRHGPAPDHPATPGGSVNAPSAATGYLGGFLLSPVSLLSRRRLDDGARPAAGPAYPPGTSPG